jgi:hypothetical protein
MGSRLEDFRKESSGKRIANFTYKSSVGNISKNQRVE